MKLRICIIIFALSFISCASLKKVDKIEKVNSKISSKHINIKGTRIFLIPPKGFVFNGENYLLDDEGNYIQAFDAIGGDFYKNSATFIPEVIEDKGLNVIEYKYFYLNNFPAKYMSFGNSALNNTSLVFGDTTFCASIFCVSKTSKEKLQEAFKKMLFSVVYDTNFEINPFENCNFILSDSASLFKFKTYSAGMFMYYPKDTINSQIDKQAFIIALELPISNESLSKLSDEMYEGMKKYGMVFTEKKFSSDNKINGLEALETNYLANLKGKEIMCFQLIVKKGDIAVSIQGTMFENYEKTIEACRKLAYTVEIK